MAYVVWARPEIEALPNVEGDLCRKTVYCDPEGEVGTALAAYSLLLLAVLHLVFLF